MKGLLHHVALCVKEFDWYVEFFEQIFEMNVRKTAGEGSARKLWFQEGIQINETTEDTVAGTACDHISLQVENSSDAVQECLRRGCKKASNGDNWIALPNGAKVEFMERKYPKSSR